MSILKTGKRTPGFLQVIKTALTIQLKEQMGIDNIMKREHEIVAYIFRIRTVSNIKILAGSIRIG
jgi:selenocysteine lyase/cysteine desulfurase